MSIVFICPEFLIKAKATAKQSNRLPQMQQQVIGSITLKPARPYKWQGIGDLGFFLYTNTTAPFLILLFKAPMKLFLHFFSETVERPVKRADSKHRDAKTA
ncbi:hypothetical protein KIH32_01235 [Pseudomonas fluorescens]|uniref:hypothetical protein n=1 Tax=Pseudomonas fluorescens TaxID=294 RepID=UPI001BD9750A|nr:hypothetical protein [Pseudomonas fluorescens]MBT0622513.1 hypothetical protein [Pseudomonas fluorescens]